MEVEFAAVICDDLALLVECVSKLICGLLDVPAGVCFYLDCISNGGCLIWIKSGGLHLFDWQCLLGGVQGNRGSMLVC
ncbi:hypothetical protein LOK49_LG06G02213 [Camellia lanceoleosa]|uniref:Uncharacterized protein n=1 Tax=Camellia lanceoleosa TaxID=1840588 RepID=A0ACC0HHX7_9ERIC|nr:hypothetical protein LOK49_LG06G02213 [Camellia lanceoleosa]